MMSWTGREHKIDSMAVIDSTTPHYKTFSTETLQK